MMEAQEADGENKNRFIAGAVIPHMYRWCVFYEELKRGCPVSKAHLFSPRKHNRNEPEILAPILDELILELCGKYK